jgi:hypothetical protein
MNARKLVLVALCAMAGVLVLSAAPAFAATENNVYRSQLNGSETAGGFFYASALAFNGSGDVFVLDAEHNVVDELESSGTKLNEINNSVEEDYTTGGAVNASGDVFVAEYVRNVVSEFAPDGTLLREITGGKTKAGSFAGAYAVAVGSSGDLYVTDYEHGVVDEFEPGAFESSSTGAPIKEFVVNEPYYVAVDGSSDDLYVTGYEGGAAAKTKEFEPGGEPQAAQGTCGEASQIGTTTAVVGPGEDPFTITGGRVYLTGPYEGQPFGLSIVVPANAGPFHLGNVVVRASIAVDRHTAALTVTTDPIPQVVDSVPIRLRKVVVDVNRPGFIFNATNCVAGKLESTITGLEGFTGSHGSSVGVSSAYHPSGCAGLAFKPSFAVSTSGKTSKAGGASLAVKLTYPTGAGYANIKQVKVDLPKQLPSRLTTLQKACVAKVFEANPASCPHESLVGTAKATTPILPVPLEGPAYFVSHGGEAFPSLIVVLQGYGVTVDLVGTTFISHAGITSSTFQQVPDVPVSTFQLTLPEGPYSALAANGSLCAAKLAMPTAFVAQNGAEIHQSTPITVEGCSTALAIASHSIKKRTLSVSVYAPAAGKVTVSGKGLRAQAKTAKGRESLTFKLHQKKAGKLKTKVTIVFTPEQGRKRERQTKRLAVKFKR